VPKFQLKTVNLAIFDWLEFNHVALLVAVALCGTFAYSNSEGSTY
jgi:hypothetical protein